MARIFNFSAGPSALPEPVLKKAADEMLNYKGLGLSVMEMSHRSADYGVIIAKAEKDLRTLLEIPDNYKVLFLEGGATHQFSSVPMNLLGDKKEADYIVTGTWSTKAANEAKRFTKVNIICDAVKVGGKAKYDHIPDKKDWKPLSKDAAYLYYCDNETIEGLEFREPPVTEAGIPLICDMSSNFLSKRFDVKKFGMVFACAQKNFGPAGLTVVVIREDLLAIPVHPATPIIFQNKLQADNKSMYNTPSSYNVYIAGLVFEWILELGGLAAIEKRNIDKAGKLYNYIDGSGYYKNPVQKENRSMMNVPFLGKDPANEKDWLAEAKKSALVTLAGHRSVGGFRASIYNAMPVEGIDKLIAFMKQYAAAHP